ncbi:MAG: CbtA family protein [bacterium]|nr:CbtA family protein [bacterium]
MFRRIVFTAALSGLLAGLFLTAAQSVRVLPLIQEAETYEKAETPKTPAPDAVKPKGDEGEASPFGRLSLTAVANITAAIGFALLLVAAYALRGGADWKTGILWGLGGFAAFSLAPALGLPPELPGTTAATVPDRQLWWWLTALLTAGGLSLALLIRRPLWIALGVLLIVFPHLIGAPQPEMHGGAAPPALMRAFIWAALLTSGVFWIVLGGLSGYLFRRLENT